MDKGLKSKHTGRRLLLIACLIPILAAWYYLVADVPIPYFQGTSGYHRLRLSSCRKHFGSVGGGYNRAGNQLSSRKESA